MKKKERHSRTHQKGTLNAAVTDLQKRKVEERGREKENVKYARTQFYCVNCRSKLYHKFSGERINFRGGWSGDGEGDVSIRFSNPAPNTGNN